MRRGQRFDTTVGGKARMGDLVAARGNGAAVRGGLIAGNRFGIAAPTDIPTDGLARSVGYSFLFVYSAKVAGVFGGERWDGELDGSGLEGVSTGVRALTVKEVGKAHWQRQG